jgi:cold shock protein
LKNAHLFKKDSYLCALLNNQLTAKVLSNQSIKIIIISMETGKVKFYKQTSKFGFITPDDGSKDVFFHESNVANEIPREGDAVQYEVGQGRKGEEAKNVCKIN